MAVIFDEILGFSFKLYKNKYKVFEVADYSSEVKNGKLKIADSIWRPFFTKFDIFRSNYTKINIRGFLRPLITIPRSKMRNLKWRIQYGDRF